MKENSYLQWLFNQFPMKNNVTYKQLSAAFWNLQTYFVAIVKKNKKRIKKNEWKLIPAVIVPSQQQLPTKVL